MITFSLGLWTHIFDSDFRRTLGFGLWTWDYYNTCIGFSSDSVPSYTLNLPLHCQCCPGAVVHMFSSGTRYQRLWLLHWAPDGAQNWKIDTRHVCTHLSMVGSIHHHNCVTSVDDSGILGKMPPSLQIGFDLILGFKKCPGQRNPGPLATGRTKEKNCHDKNCNKLHWNQVSFHLLSITNYNCITPARIRLQLDNVISNKDSSQFSH